MMIVKQIKQIMRAKGISQSEFADLLGMAPSQLSAILKESESEPEYNFTIKMLTRFASALGVPLTISMDPREVDLRVDYVVAPDHSTTLVGTGVDAQALPLRSSEVRWTNA